MTIHYWDITSDDDSFSNEDIETLDTVESLPIEALEYTPAEMNVNEDDFFKANISQYRIYSDENNRVYFVKK